MVWAHRALRNRKCLESGILRIEAFFRRSTDVTGLSVATKHEYAKQMLKSGVGVAALPVEGIQGINGLDVAWDSDVHGNIIGVPYYSDDYDKAVEVADRLVAIAIATQDIWRDS